MYKEKVVNYHDIGKKVKVVLEGTLLGVDAGGAYYVQLDDDYEEQVFQIRSPEDIELVEVGPCNVEQKMVVSNANAPMYRTFVGRTCVILNSYRHGCEIWYKLKDINNNEIFDSPADFWDELN